MKLIGRNSASKYLQWIFLALFVYFAFPFVYVMFGFAISCLNYKNGTHFLSGFFILGNDVGWGENPLPDKMNGLLKFKFYYPFTQSIISTGIFGLPAFFMAFFGMGYFTAYTFSLYKLFGEFKKDVFFKGEAMKFLKIYAWINILYLPLKLLVTSLFGRVNLSNTGTGLTFIFFGIVILFVIEFFKKSIELQSENDLTI